jgi:hypothetical protein
MMFVSLICVRIDDVRSCQKQIKLANNIPEGLIDIVLGGYLMSPRKF